MGEPVVDPARDLQLERSVAGAVRQIRLGRGQPVEECVDRTAPAERTGGAERNSSADQAIARNAVDEPRVQVVHHREPVAVEVVGDDRRRRRRGRRERCLDLPLERRAPEGEEVAGDLRELREHEPLGDCAAGELADVQERRAESASGSAGSQVVSSSTVRKRPR